MAVLQVALDLTDLMKVLELSAEIASITGCEGVWLEADRGDKGSDPEVPRTTLCGEAARRGA